MRRYASTSVVKNSIQNLRSNKPSMYRNTVYPSIPISITDTYVETGFGDRLDVLARIFYKDESLWWVIASANPDTISFDSLALKAGLQLRIPSNPSLIVQLFNSLNGGSGGGGGGSY